MSVTHSARRCDWGNVVVDVVDVLGAAVVVVAPETEVSSGEQFEPAVVTPNTPINKIGTKAIADS